MSNAQLRAVEPIKFTHLEAILKRENIPYRRACVGEDPYSLEAKDASPFASQLIYQFTDMPGRIYVDAKLIEGQVLYVETTRLFPDLAFNSAGVRIYVYRESGLFDSAAIRLKEMYDLTLDISREENSYYFNKFIGGDMTEDEILSAIQSVRTAHLALKEVQEKEKQRIDDNLTLVLDSLEEAKRQQ